MSRRAFTLVELLVVIAIIAVLIGILAFSLRGVRAAAIRTRSLSAVRQIVMGYSSYTLDHSGRLLPGYIDETLFQGNELFKDLRVFLPSGVELDDEDKQSYVWRLAPYLDDAWEAFVEDMNDIGAMTEFEAEYFKMLDPAKTSTPGFISERPSFGLNSIFVGGDSRHGGSAIAERHPWNTAGLEPLAAVRLSEVLNPAKLIVFGPAANVDTLNADAVYFEPAVGFCELRAPYLKEDPDDPWDMQQWRIVANGAIDQTPSGEYAEGAGLPIARAAGDFLHSGKQPVPVAHLDGSTASDTLVNLSADMRRWYAFDVALRPVTPDPP